MASGTEQFGFITTPVLVNLNSKGVGVKCVSTVDGNEPTNPADDSTVLVAAKGSGITCMKDLAGKNVAEVQLTSLNSLAVMVLAKQAGIDPAPSTRSRSRSRRCPPRCPRAGCRPR